MNQYFLKLTASIFLTGVLCVGARAQTKLSSEMSICSLTLPETLKQARANFSIIYSLQLDNTGAVSRLIKIQDDFVGKENVLSCVSDWRFRGLPDGAKLIATFKWKHAKGWVEVSVVGKEFSQIMRIKQGPGY